MSKRKNELHKLPCVMNILHVTPAYYPATYWGGPMLSVYGLNNALARLPNVHIRVLTTDSAGPQVAERVDVESIDRRLFPNQDVIFTRRVAGSAVSPELARKLLSLIRWADIVHLTATYSFPTIPTLGLCRLFSKPLVWSPRGAILDSYQWSVPHPHLKRIWERVCNALIRRGLVIMHNTAENEQIACEARMPKALAITVPNGVDVLPVLPPRDWQPAGRLRLIYIGRLSQKKGIENLLYAMKALDDPAISLRLYGVGDASYTQTLYGLANELNLSRSATFMGEVTGVAKAAAFLASDLCVVPSHSENFCNVVTEALAHGVPVIASRGTPWRELEPKNCGWWVDNSPQTLAQTIRMAGAQPLMDMGRRGWEWMAADYSWNVVANQMMDVFCGLLQKRKVGAYEQK